MARRPPGRSRAQERPEAEAAELSGRRGAGAGGQPPPILAGSAPSRPGAARGPGSCLSPPSSTVGATLSSQGAGEVEVGGAAWVPGLGGEAPCGLATLRAGAGTHLPEGARRGGHLPGKGALGKRLGAGALSESPQPPQAGFRFLEEDQRFSPGMREVCGTSRPCLLVVEKPTSEVCLSDFLTSPPPHTPPPAYPGYAKGSQGQSV